MIDENKTDMNDTPPAPNGHANGTTATPTAEGASKGAPSSSEKKKKNKKVRQHNQKPAAAQVDAAAAPTTELSTDVAVVPILTAETVTPTEETAAPPILDAAPITAPIADAAVPIVDTVDAPIEAPAERLRLRMKVWTDPATAKRYLIPSAFMRDLVDGQPVSDVMYAYVISDAETKLILLKASEWNALPFFYFQEDGPAPRATKRPVDVIL